MLYNAAIQDVLQGFFIDKDLNFFTKLLPSHRRELCIAIYNSFDQDTKHECLSGCDYVEEFLDDMYDVGADAEGSISMMKLLNMSIMRYVSVIASDAVAIYVSDQCRYDDKLRSVMFGVDDYEIDGRRSL